MRGRYGEQDAQRHMAQRYFVETVKEWQKQWFYITEPRDATWAAAPKFRAGAPMRLTSWKEKYPN